VPYFRLRVPSAPAVCQSILAVQSVSRRVERRSKHGIVNASRLPTGYTEDGRDRIFKIDHERTFEIMSVLNPCSGLQHTQVHQHPSLSWRIRDGVSTVWSSYLSAKTSPELDSHSHHYVAEFSRYFASSSNRNGIGSWPAVRYRPEDMHSGKDQAWSAVLQPY